MESGNFIVVTCVAALGIFGTIAGTFIGLIGSIVKDSLARKAEKEARAAQWRKEFSEKYIIEPIIDHIDLGLWYLTHLGGYSKGALSRPITEDELVNLNASLLDLILQEGQVEARVESLGNDELLHCFREYQELCIRVWKKFKEGEDEIRVGSDMMQEARMAAAKVIAHLQPGK